MFSSPSTEFLGSMNSQPLTIILLERLNDAAFLMDSHGSFTYGNPSAHKLLNCSTAKILAMTIADLPLASLLQIWSNHCSKTPLGKTLHFNDQYTTGSDDKITVEITVSCEQGVEQDNNCLLIRQLETEPPISESVEESILPNIPQLESVFRFIEENYDRSISLKDVAMAMGYCPSYLTDLVRRCSGQTVNYWIIKRRIALACSLLKETNNSVNQIAASTGYQNEGHFFRQFRQHCGMTPLAWRKSQKVK
jgi:AraC-like DNA-binding protein